MLLLLLPNIPEDHQVHHTITTCIMHHLLKQTSLSLVPLKFQSQLVYINHPLNQATDMHPLLQVNHTESLNIKINTTINQCNQSNHQLEVLNKATRSHQLDIKTHTNQAKTICENYQNIAILD